MKRAAIIQHIRMETDGDPSPLLTSIRKTALPERASALLLPRIDADFGVVEHLIREGRRPWDSPSEEVKASELCDAVTFGCVTIEPGAELTRVTYEYRPDCVGAPRRWSWPKRLEVRTGEWVQVAYNGRFSSWTDRWYYARAVFNVGVFDSPTGREFVEMEPVARYRDLAQLW